MKNKFVKVAFISIAFSLLSGCGSHEHIYSENDVVWNWVSNQTNTGYVSASATFKCQKCKEEVTIDADLSNSQSVPASCTSDGILTWTASASINNEIYSDTKETAISKYGHSFNHDHYCGDENNHWYECSECHSPDPETIESHIWDGDYVITKEADYGVEGIKTRTCIVCEYVDNVSIPALIPSLEMVQNKINKVLTAFDNGLEAYDIYTINDAIRFYSYLPSGAEALINNYDKVLEAKETYNDTYVRIAKSFDKGSILGDYVGSWDGTIREDIDDVYGDVSIINMTSDGYIPGGEPGSAWEGNGFNGIKPLVDSSIDECEKIVFWMFNPNETEFRMFMAFNEWDYAVDLGDYNYNLSSGWNKFELTIYRGCKNNNQARVSSNTDITDINVEGITLCFAGDFLNGTSTDKLNRDFLVTPIYGIKTPQEKVDQVQDLLNSLSADASDTEIDYILEIYNGLSKVARDQINLDKIYEIKAGRMIALIDNLPGVDEVMLSDAKTIMDLYAAYSALEDEIKSRVTNANKFEELLAKINALKAANIVDIINSLPEPNDVVATSGSKISEARSIYDSLSDDLKANVSNYQRLVDVETAYNTYFAIASDVSSYRYYDFDGYNGAGKVTLSKSIDDVYGDILVCNTEKLEYALGLQFSAIDVSEYQTIEFYAKVDTPDVNFSLVQPWWSNTFDWTNQTQTGQDLNIATNVKVNKVGEWVRYQMSAQTFTEYISKGGLFVFFKMGASFSVSISNIYAIKASYAIKELENKISVLPNVDDAQIYNVNEVNDAQRSYDALSSVDQAKVSSELSSKLASLTSKLQNYAMVAHASSLKSEGDYGFTFTNVISSNKERGDACEITNGSYTGAWCPFIYESSTNVQAYSELVFFVYNPNGTTHSMVCFEHPHWDPAINPLTTLNPGWNEVTIDLSSGCFPTTAGSGFFGIMGMNNTIESGWLISSMYAVK